MNWDKLHFGLWPDLGYSGCWIWWRWPLMADRVIASFAL